MGEDVGTSTGMVLRYGGSTHLAAYNFYFKQEGEMMFIYGKKRVGRGMNKNGERSN